MSDAEQHYLWLDLETTGLDPVNDRILEVAWAFEPKSSLGHGGTIYSTLVGSVCNRLDPVVEEMHTESGLLSELAVGGWPKVWEAEEYILTTIHNLNKPILAGASVHFDRSFLRVHMPRLEARLHHRHFDTSTLKMFFDSVGVPRLPEDWTRKHRAAADIKNCLAVVRHYRSFTRNESDLDPPDCDGEDWK